MTRTGSTLTMTIEEFSYIAEVSRELGYTQAEADMAFAWATMAKRVRRTVKQPTFAELQQLRYAS